MPGATPKAEALMLLPAGTHCKRLSRMGITGYIVQRPEGKQIASAGNPVDAWKNALGWAPANMSA